MQRQQSKFKIKVIEFKKAPIGAFLIKSLECFMESLYFIKDEHKSKKAPIGAF
jgi:hypothetical protein